MRDHQSPCVVRPVGSHSGRDDDGHRCPDAELHAHRFRDAENPEDFEEHWNDDRAAAHTEQSREKAGDDARAHDGDRQPGELTKGHSEIYSAAARIGAALRAPAGKSNRPAGSRSQ